jgi:predicted ATPase/DNA-binding SARP family transcriptional activator
VRIRLLGEVGAATDRGEPLDAGPAKCQAVLAALALSAGTAVPVWRLVDVVWGDDPPRTANRTLQSYLTRLRKSLGPDSIVRSGAAYRLAVPAESVDVLRFQRRLDAGNIDAALAEWTGLPLAGLTVPGLAATVDGLVERWLGAVEADLERRVETSAPAAIGPLTELTASYPFREGLWALLMTALYRAERQADALAAYRTARQNLAEHLGVEPGPRLRELESLVLDHDERLAGSIASSAPGRPTGTVTFGFSEVVDSARWWAAHPREMAGAMARHDAVAGSVTSRHGGYVFATGGDSFGVAFHRAADAVLWATELQSGIGGQHGPGGAEIQLRIGLHTGEAAERERGYFGPAVHVAARLAAAGHGGQTLVSGASAAVLDGTGLRDLGTYRLDGVVAVQRIYQLGNGEYPPLRTEDTGRGNLPRRLGRLIGRDEDLKIIGDGLATCPVVTLVGAGGIGKTRLALAAARHVVAQDGAWLIDLAEIALAGDVPRAVAGPLGIKESPGRPLDRSIVAALSSRQLLLVLDNCEHVIDGAAELAQAIAEGCPDVQVLATSREGLGLGHGLERIIAVAPLEPAGPGAELFSERASAASVTFDPQASRGDIEEICRRLDGVPLAIELAAARTASLTPADVLRRLDDHLRLLTRGQRGGAERHRTLRATIQWSYDLLSPAEQLLFSRLSIFVGPFDIAAAQMVAADGALGAADVDDLLGDLVARSMLVAQSGPFGQRFRLLETMRQFAAERLAETGDTDMVAQRHARWCRDLVGSIQQLLAGPAEVEGVARLDELRPNHRAAFEWACSRSDRHLAHALVRPVVVEVVRRSRGELADWVERILAMTPPDDTELVVFGLTWAAQRYKLGQDPAAWERLAGRYGEPDHPLIRHARASVHQDWAALATWTPPAMTELRRRGDGDLAEQFELDAVAPLIFAGQYADGDAAVAALAGRYRRHGPPTLLHLSLMLLGYSATLQGDRDRGEQLFGEAVAVEVPERTQSPNKSIEARALFRHGETARAFRVLAAHIDELLDTGNMQAICVTCAEFINMMVAAGRLADAACMLHHLDRAAPHWATLVAEARTKVAAVHSPSQAREPDLDDHQALEYMRRVLRQLASGQDPAS